MYILLYFVISHLVLLTQLSKNYDFNLKLANSYLWPFFIIKHLHEFLVYKLVIVFDFFSVISNHIKNVAITTNGMVRGFVGTTFNKFRK